MQVNNDDTVCPAETNPKTLCSRGMHQFRLDEEIGLICMHCSHVELEIKYILPSFVSCKDLSLIYCLFIFGNDVVLDFRLML